MPARVPGAAGSATAGARPDGRRPDRPRHGDRRAARHDRGDRPDHGRGHHPVPRRARRALVGRRARPDQRHRPGDDGGASRPPPALRRRALGRAQLGTVWRFTALGGLAGGLAAAPLLSPSGPPAAAVAASLAAFATLALAARLPRARDEAAPRAAAVTWLCGVALAAATLGIGIGSARTDGDRRRRPAARPGCARWSFAATSRRRSAALRRRGRGPRPDAGGTAAGRGARARPGPRDRAGGRGARRRPPAGRLAARLPDPARDRRRPRRDTDRAAPRPRARGSPALLDGVRTRAEAALCDGHAGARPRACCAASSSARTTASTRTRSTTSSAPGLAHLLAVSGQNVVLLAILAAAALAALGVCAPDRGSSGSSS